MNYTALQFFFFVSLLNFTNIYSAVAPKQREYHLSASGVLPLYRKDNEVFTILGRLTEYAGKDKGTWGHFTGKADPDDNGNSLIVGAREFIEEARLEPILNMKQATIEEYITRNTQGIVILVTKCMSGRYDYAVMYLIDTTQDMKDALFNQFESSYNIIKKQYDNSQNPTTRKKLSSFIETDVLCSVKWDDINQGQNKEVITQEISTQSKDTVEPVKKGQKVKLRPILKNVLEGRVNDNKFMPSELHTLDLGIFIFGSQKMGLSKYEKLELTAEEKLDVWQRVAQDFFNKKSAHVSTEAPIYSWSASLKKHLNQFGLLYGAITLGSLLAVILILQMEINSC